MGAVGGDAGGIVAHTDGLDDRPGRGVELGHRVVVDGRHPDVGAVGGDTEGKVPTPMVWTTDPVEASSSVTVASRSVRHPDVGAVGGDTLESVPTPMVWTNAPVEASSSVTCSRRSSPPRRGCRQTRCRWVS